MKASRPGEVLVIGAGPSGATAIARVLAEGISGLSDRKGRRAGWAMPHPSRPAHRCDGSHSRSTHLPLGRCRSLVFVERFAAFHPYRRGDRRHRGKILFASHHAPHDAGLLRPRSRRELGAAVDPRPLVITITPRNFEEQGRHMLGDALYEAFFESYTRKQWGVEPSALPASILKRIPLRFNEDRNYFHHSRVGIPTVGYTAMMAEMLNHPLIVAHYGVDVTQPVLRLPPRGLHGTSGSMVRTSFRAAPVSQPVVREGLLFRDVPAGRSGQLLRHADRAVDADHGAQAFRPMKSTMKRHALWKPATIAVRPTRLTTRSVWLAIRQRYSNISRPRGRCPARQLRRRLATYRYIDMDAAIRKPSTRGGLRGVPLAG